MTSEPALDVAALTSELEIRTVGEGSPTTVFAHGLAGDSHELGGLAAGVTGQRVLFSWRGHGTSAGFDRLWDYRMLAEDLTAVCRSYGATRAVGASMGAGGALRAVIDGLVSFDRMVLLTPSVIDSAHSDHELEDLLLLADLVADGDVQAVATELLRRLPEPVRARAGAPRMAQAQAARLAARPPARGARGAVPVEDLALLSRVTCPVLILAQTNDPLHPVSVAASLAEALPDAQLEILSEGGIHFTERTRARDLVKQFLA
ncbi:MAG TPA: alpha/beta hydrolase [Mycobacteriales bacterium]|nr:alpha/beta hydrolase [Mycobacteriales bacterium]